MSNQVENIEDLTFILSKVKNGKGLNNANEEASIKSQKECKLHTLAEEKRIEGNAYYRTGKFYAALQLYLEAIELWPQNTFLYSNASASYMMLGMYSEALDMAKKTVKTDPSFSKGFLRIGRCNLALGNLKEAVKAFAKTKEIDDSLNKEIEIEMARLLKLQEYLNDGKLAANMEDYSLAAALYYSAYKIASASSSIILLCAEYFIQCDKIFKAKEIALELLEQNVEDANARCILGMIAYHQDEKESAFKELEEALRISRHHTHAKLLLNKARNLYHLKEAGNEAFNQQNYTEALKKYLKGVRVDPQNKNLGAKLHFNIASVRSKMSMPEEAIQSLTTALLLNPKYVKAYLKRAALYQETDEHNRAVQDLRQVVHLDPTGVHKLLLHDALDRQRHHSKKNYYQMLELPSTATEEEVKNAYKRLALLHHPDRHACLEEKQKHEKVFKDVSEAYGVLKDSFKRAEYDGMYDDEDDDIDSEEEFDYEHNLCRHFFFSRYFKYGDPWLYDFYFDDEDFSSDDEDADDDDDDDDYCSYFGNEEMDELLD